MHYELVEELFTDSRARTVLAKSRSKPSEQRSIRLPVRASLAKGFRALGGLSDFHQMTQVDHEGLMRWVAVEEFAGIACAIT